MLTVCSPTASAVAVAAAGPGGKLIKTTAFLSHNLSTMCVFFLLPFVSFIDTQQRVLPSLRWFIIHRRMSLSSSSGGVYFGEFFTILFLLNAEEMFRKLNLIQKHVT